MGVALKATSLRTAFFRNATANVIRLASFSVVALLLTPLLVHRLSTETYAAWVLIVQLSTYVMFLDFGIQGAVSHFVTYTEEKQDLNLRDGIVSSAFWLLAGLAALGVLLIGGSRLAASTLVRERASVLAAGSPHLPVASGYLDCCRATGVSTGGHLLGTATERSAGGDRDCRAYTLGGADRRSGLGAP